MKKITFSLMMTIAFFTLPNQINAQNWCCCANGCFQDVVFIGCTAYCPSFAHGFAVSPGYFADVGSCNVSCSAMPVEMKYFTTKVLVTNDIELRWGTLTEVNNEGFEIQRAAGLKMEWEALDFVHGYGNTSEIQHYSFIDEKAPPGVNYYRLSQVDFDGTATFTEIEVANLENNELFSLWPTLAKDAIVLNANALSYEGYRLEIYDLMGRRLIKKEIDDQAMKVDVSNLPPGNYIASISSRSDLQTLRFVKVR